MTLIGSYSVLGDTTAVGAYIFLGLLLTTSARVDSVVYAPAGTANSRELSAYSVRTVAYPYAR
jgi:hypothetical protein